jgi:hypothetical protein
MKSYAKCESPHCRAGYSAAAAPGAVTKNAPGRITFFMYPEKVMSYGSWVISGRVQGMVSITHHPSPITVFEE